jgi:hypothetical protein
MKNLLMSVVAALLCSGQDGKSALESDPSGWVDVFPDKDFKGWKRLPLDPKEPLATKAVWKHSADGKTLLCDGTGGVKELLLNEEERGDGIFHVEWRWGKDQGEKPSTTAASTSGARKTSGPGSRPRSRAARNRRSSATSSRCCSSTGSR